MLETEFSLLQTLTAHRSDVTCVDIFGRIHLVTCSSDKLIRFWRWSPGLGFVEEEFSPARGHKYGVVCVNYSPQGTMVASTSIDGCSRVWRTRDGEQTHHLLQPGGHGVRTCRFTSDSLYLMTGADDGSVCVWNLLQKRLTRVIRGHEGAVQSLCLSAEGALLITACTLSVMKIYSVQDAVDPDETLNVRDLFSVDDAHDLGVLCVDALTHATDCDSESLIGWRSCEVISGGQDQRIRIWQARWRPTVAGGKTSCRAELISVKQLIGHSSAVIAIRWCNSADRTNIIFASASVDKTVRIWSRSGKCIRVLDAHNRYVNTVAFSIDGSLLVTGSNDKLIKVWSSRLDVGLDSMFEPPCTLLSHYGCGDLEGIGPAESTLNALASVKGDMYRLYSDTVTHTAAVNSVRFYGDHLIATACSDKLVRLFRWSDLDSNLEQLQESPLIGHKYPVMAIEFGACGAVILSCSLDGTGIIWDTANGNRLGTLSVESASSGVGSVAGSGGGGARDASFSIGGYMLIAGDDHIAPIWKLGDETVEPINVYTGHTDTVTCCSFTPDEHYALTASYNGDFRLYTTPTAWSDCVCEPEEMFKQLLVQDDAHDLGVLTCDFSCYPELLTGDTKAYLLATGGCDSLAKLWIITVDMNVSGRCSLFRSLSGHGGNVTCVRFSPSGELLATTATDKQARLWCVSTSHCLQCVTMSSGAACCSISSSRLLAVGCLDGELLLWRLPSPTVHETKPGSMSSPDVMCIEHARYNTLTMWTMEQVALWIRDYVAGAPELYNVTHEEDTVSLLACIKRKNIDGARIAAATTEQLLIDFGRDESPQSQLSLILKDELDWLKLRSTTCVQQRCHVVGDGDDTPHQYLCPVTHQLMMEPVKCSDGFTYERAAILECFLSSGKLVSPMTNQPLLNGELSPNYELKKHIRQYIADTYLQ